jgi:hypothetical protein
MISPNTGSVAGGTSVTVTGTGFTPSTTLSIGGEAARVCAQSACLLSFVARRGAAQDRADRTQHGI